MAFLSVIMCNVSGDQVFFALRCLRALTVLQFAGTNIGTTILLCRVVQAWLDIHRHNGLPITRRTFWGTVYSMALGVNYGQYCYPDWMCGRDTNLHEQAHSQPHSVSLSHNLGCW